MNAQIIVPVLIIGAIAAAAGSKPKRRGGSYIEEDPLPDVEPGPDQLPIDNRMLFDPTCYDLIVRVNAPEYDARITTAYWALRQEGMNDPVAIAAELLRMDAPQCAWPARPGVSSPQAVAIWEGTVAAVVNYHELAESGQLGQFEPIFGF